MGTERTVEEKQIEERRRGTWKGREGLSRPMCIDGSGMREPPKGEEGCAPLHGQRESERAEQRGETEGERTRRRKGAPDDMGLCDGRDPPDVHCSGLPAGGLTLGEVGGVVDGLVGVPHNPFPPPPPPPPPHPPRSRVSLARQY
ncbi:unnamed protein product [Pleuronectes platessa]|uniref:Uncharacterized protein n=1 Tax=Pleuronectes platessa TaxID=8262 RepID=A0A9N7UNP0_PLEPL|nr:unnamed protein product [Pleuronectes platessa]